MTISDSINELAERRSIQPVTASIADCLFNLESNGEEILPYGGTIADAIDLYKEDQSGNPIK